MKYTVSQARPTAEPGRRISPWTARDVRVLALEPTGSAVPAGCACCGAAASSSRVEHGRGEGRSLIVPYCDACQLHASRATTRSLVAGLSSAIFAVTLGLGLPLVWEHARPASFVLVVVAASVFPALAIAAIPRRLEPGHSALGRAAWWNASGELVCTQARWAAELAKSAAVDARLGRARERALSPWALTGPILALVGAPVVHRFHHPPVRVLNLTDTRIELAVDGERVVSVEPTSSESPAAGVEIRLPSGKRELRVIGADGALVDSAHVVVQSGARHLYAPGSADFCFWLERSYYGRAQLLPVERRALGGSVRFWKLPNELDTWFAPNPEPPQSDLRSSGGELLALRQARCSVAPAEVRNAPQ